MNSRFKTRDTQQGASHAHFSAGRRSGQMAKGAQAREAKSAAQASKDAAAKSASEAREAAAWSVGSKGKSKGDEKAEKAAEAAKKKAERERLLAEEEAASAKPQKEKEPKKKPVKPKAPAVPDFDKAIADAPHAAVPEYSASGIDDALDALSLVQDSTEKSAVGARAAVAVEQHPERRVKAAFEAYKEANLASMKKDYPGLRLQQYNDRLWAAFQRSPENPFNSTVVSFDATKAEKVAALEQDKQSKEARLRVA